jgi:hypothetical protein
MRPSSFLNATVLLLAVALSTAGCSSTASNPADGGLAYGALPTFNMSEYYYPRTAGQTFLYAHKIENYDKTGNLVSTFAGSTDTLRTLGYKGISPLGDSLFGVSITYRVLSNYANRPEMTLWYVKNGSSQNGAFTDSKYDGCVAPPRPTKPVPCDTILAGLYGRMKSIADDFESGAARVWQTDYLFFTAHKDSVLIWYREGENGDLRTIRQVFYDDIRRQLDWQYGLWETSTILKVVENDTYVTVGSNQIRSTKIEVVTPADDMPTREWKWFGIGLGPVKQVDEWYVAPNGSINDRVKKVMTRELTQVLK